MTFWTVFIAGTIASAFFSWKFSVKARRYHGIARFFAFESILALFLLNVRFWFEEPFSPFHVLAWIFLTASLVLAVHGAWFLLKLGKPHGQVENTTRLVVRGAYKFIRHPLYASLILLGCGIFLKRVTLATSALALLDAGAVFLTARIEEKEMAGRFGAEYEAYRAGTKMFIPFII